MCEFKKVRILFISLRSDYGGGPKHIYDIVVGMSSTFKAHIACPVQKPFYNMYKAKGVNIFPLPARAFSLSSVIALLKYARENDIDIIHSHGKGAGIYSRLLGVLTGRPVIHTFHGIHYQKYSNIKQWLYFITEMALSRLTRYIINVSEAEYAEGLRFRLFPRSKARVISNGVDIKKLCNCPIDKRLESIIRSIKKENILICTVARFDYVKGLDVAIQAMKYLARYHKNFKYIIIGDGELRSSLVEAIDNCGMNNHVLLLGFRDDVPGILPMMDIYLSPSRSESMSLTLLEAMGIGLPVVATDIAGNKEVLKKGVLARSEDPLDIARKISMLIKSPELRDNLSEIGRKTVKKYYTLENMIHKTERLYNKLLSPGDIFSSISRSKKREMMRVGINASKYYKLNTGVGRYTSNLCRYIIGSDNGNDYYFYLPGLNSGPYRKDMTGVQLEKQRVFLQNNTLRILWEQILLPIRIRKDRLDLFHYTDHAMSLIQRMYPIVITVHDIAYIRFPGLLNKSRQIYKKYILNLSIKMADIIIADSHSTKRDIVEFFNVDEKKIKVVHLGVESRFRPISNVEDYRTKNNLPSKVILNIGTLEPRKNVVTLIKAFKKLQARGLKDYVLVIAGEKGWLYKQIFEEVKSSGVEQSIRLLGIVRDEDLPLLYNCADLFVYPSLYEGFGLPPLEAMACGVPIITSNTSSLPEVVGNAGIMVDPCDINSLYEAIYNVLEDSELRHRMRRDGLKRSKMFTWEKMVNEVLEIYNEVLS